MVIRHFTKDSYEYGIGVATQAITNETIKIDKIINLNQKK